MCTSCGQSCGGKCKKTCIKIYKPTVFIGGQTGIPGPGGAPGVGIANIVFADNTMTIIMTDGTEYVWDLPAAEIPNDDWVLIEENGPGISGVTWQGSATNTVGYPIVSVGYKVISPNTALVKVYAFLDCTITAPGNSLNFRFALANIPIGGSDWFPTESKVFMAQLESLPFVITPFAVPLQVTPVWDGVSPGILQPTLDQYQSKGRATIGNGLVSCQGIGPVLPNGHYQFTVEFEIMCNLIPA